MRSSSCSTMSAGTIVVLDRSTLSRPLPFLNSMQSTLLRGIVAQDRQRRQTCCRIGNELVGSIGKTGFEILLNGLGPALHVPRPIGMLGSQQKVDPFLKLGTTFANDASCP